jgi:uncharacterized protein YfaS (alpha-2-macroglobulin family)
VWLLALGAAAACVRSGPPPAPGGTLSPGQERGGRADEGAFRVVFAGPREDAPAEGEISIVFSRALRSLEVDAPPPPVTITPAIAGKWLWVGGRALRFVPDAAKLPNATEFSVEVPAGLTALDGAKLGEPYRFSFRTPRPKLVHSEPGNGSDGLVPSTQFELFFNQAVDPVELERHAKLELVGPKARQLAFSAARLDPNEPKRVRISPKAPLPLASSVRFVIDEKLTGLEGKLPSGAPQAFEVRTYDPLAVSNLTCFDDHELGGCVPGSSLTLEFNNEVKLRDLKKALSITPEVTVRWNTWQEDDGLSAWYTINANFKPATTYTLRLDPSLRDRHGQPLSKGFSKTLRFGDRPPALAIGIQGEALEAARARPIPVGYLNVPNFELVKARVAPERLQDVAFESSDSFLQRLSRIQGASRENVTSSVGKNQVGRREIDTEALLGGGRGVFGVAASYQDRRRGWQHVHSQLVKVSDLAITGKLSRFGSLVWVTSLETGRAVPDAEVSLSLPNAPKKSYRTDSRGLAHVPAADFTPNFDDYQQHALILASKGKDYTFERVSDHLSPWRLPVNVDLSGRLDTYGLLFTERGVYRPGDEVRVKGIVRDETATGNFTPKGRSYEVVLTSPSGEEIGKQRVTTNEFGSFSAKLKLPAAVELGTCRIVASTSDKPGKISAYFDVAEYRPAEFKVAVETREREVFRGTDPGFVVRGDYLYGAPMSGAKVTYNFAREPATFTLPRHEGFVTDASAYYYDLDDAAPNGGSLRDGEGSLDAEGKLGVPERIELPNQRFPERVVLSAEVTDATRQAQGAQGSVLVHPATFYVGLKTPEDYFFEAPKSISPEVVTATPKGERLAGKTVKLELVRRRWTYTRQDLGDGDSHAVSKTVDEVVSRCSLVTRTTPASCELKADRAGYYLVRARSEDSEKRAVEAAIGLYGIGAGEFGWGDNDRGVLEIVPNKKQYQVGETARFLVKSPFKEAEALVTIERAGVYHVERTKLVGATPTVSVKVTPELAPNAFVSVHLITPRGAGKNEPLGPAYRYGYAELPVDPEARRLQVQVKPAKTDLLPGQEAEVDFAVTDRSGKAARAELTVYAVDEGVLMLTGYRTPDPVPVFGAARALAVATLETREGLAKISLADFMAIGGDKGMDGGGGGFGAVRQDFRQVALFEPNVVTDAQGKAKVRFKLPDSLTTYRIMAVAVSGDDRYGFGESRVTASKPLMIRPALPRFLRAGDTLEAAAVIAAKGITPGRVTVRAEVSGAELQGPAEQTIELGKDASKEVRFKLSASKVGTLKIGFFASSSVARDAASLERRVQVPAALETVAVYGETKGSVSEKLGDLAMLRPDVGGVEVALSSSALVGLDAGLEELVDYPYACTEQLASRLLPLGPLAELARAFDWSLPKNATALRDKTIAEIVARQRGDGGFGMWQNSPSSSDWVTPYALWVLKQAQKGGAPVPEQSLKRGRDFLKRWLSNFAKERPAAAAFAVDVLAELGAPDHGYTEQLWERRAELPVFSRALVLHALVIGKGPDAMRDTLLRELENALRISGNSAKFVENVGDEYASLMDSPARTTAIVLRAILAAKPDHPLAARLVRGLLDARQGGRWRSTQETAFALVALDAYRRAQETSSPDFSARALVGDKAIATLNAKGKGIFSESASSPMSALVSGGPAIVLEKDGSGTLFYELRLKYARRTPPATALDAGFFVKKTLRAVKPTEIAQALGTIPENTVTRFKAGDLVLADLVIVAPSPSTYVVIDDPLPAGFEAVDTNLQTTAAWLDVPSSSGSVSSSCPGCDPDSRDDLAHGRAYLNVWHRRELRDDRALFFVDDLPAGMVRFRYLARATSLGRFVVPPTKAEEMYEPETFGRTAASVIEVQ